MFIQFHIYNGKFFYKLFIHDDAENYYYFKLLGIGERHINERVLFKNTAKKSPVVMTCHYRSRVTASSDVSQQNVSSGIDLYVYSRVLMFQ